MDFQVWDFPGQIDIFENPTYDMDAIFGEIGALIWVIDAQDDYLEAVARLNTTILNLQRSYPNINIEVFIHKVDGLSDDYHAITRLMKSVSEVKTSSSGWLCLHAAYHLVTIRLNSSAAYPAQSSSIFSSSYSAMKRCLSAVDHMRQLCQLVRVSGLLDKVGPPFAFAAWVSARVALVHGSIMDHNLDPDIDFFVSFLSEMGQYWEVAKRYSEILGRVLEEYRASQQAGSERPSTIRILADMRR